MRVCSTSSVRACRDSGQSEHGPARRLPIARRTQRWVVAGGRLGSAQAHRFGTPI